MPVSYYGSDWFLVSFILSLHGAKVQLSIRDFSIISRTLSGLLKWSFGGMILKTIVRGLMLGHSGFKLASVMSASQWVLVRAPAAVLQCSALPVHLGKR